MPSVAAESPFTYQLVNIFSGNVVAELPFNQATFSKRLNTPGQFQATLDVYDPRVQAQSWQQYVIPWQTMVFVDYNPTGQDLGQIAWAGVITGTEFTRSRASQMKFLGMEAWQYFAQRVQAKDYTNTWASSVADPMAIARTVINDAYGLAASYAPWSGNSFSFAIGTNGSTPLGDYITIQLPLSQYQTVDTIVTNLSQMGYGTGFDFSFDWNYDLTLNPPFLGFDGTVNLWYPRQGRTGSSTPILIDVAVADDYTYTVDGTQMANHVFDVGSKSASKVTNSGTSAQISANLVNTQSLVNGWPVLDRVNQYTQINSVAVANAIVSSDLHLYSYPTSTVQVEWSVGDSPTLTTFGIGDDVNVFISPDERFPSGMIFTWRVTGIDVTVNDQGRATQKATLNIPPGTLPIEPPI